MSTPEPHLENLSSEQREAVLAPPGPALVLAGAGSGKTRVIVQRILHLISQGASPASILAITFTNKAAGEMKERLRTALGAGPRGVWIGTFHATGARILRAEYERVGVPRDFVVMGRGECLTLIKRAMKKEGINPERYPPRDILEWIGRMKTSRVPEGQGPGGSDAFPHSAEAVASRLAKPYERLLRDAGGVDFDDLLALPLVLFRKHADVLERYRAQFTEILVDEYQDTNAVQHHLIRFLAGEGHRVFAVGDDDQSIYRWRGAEVENIRRFETEFPGARVFKLEENYRCSGRILAAAAGVMRRSNGRREKNLYTNNPDGEPVLYFAGADPQVEAQMIFQRLAKAGAGEAIPWGEAAVFYRTNTQSRALEQEARRRKVPYQIVKGQRFFDRAEVQDLSAYLRAALNPSDAAAFTRIVNRPTRGLGPAKILAISGGDEDGLISIGVARDALASGLVTGAAGRSLQELIAILGELAGARLGPVAMLNEIIERTGYRRWLEETSRTSPSVERRAAASRGLEGIGEFLVAAEAFEVRIREEEGIEPDDPEAMIRFMEDMALSSEADDMEDEEGGRLSLMTLHAAKGLEFQAVAMA
ncbi:MAG: UvrD-helicase domain-containing protein, partial [Nitrospinaceae bacterium]|nr:UvrD-helicase domain-containing protein [Nitrospinaceae bacterium]